jgi:hypothetical protein
MVERMSAKINKMLCLRFAKSRYAPPFIVYSHYLNECLQLAKNFLRKKRLFSLEKWMENGLNLHRFEVRVLLAVESRWKGLNRKNGSAGYSTSSISGILEKNTLLDH